MGHRSEVPFELESLEAANSQSKSPRFVLISKCQNSIKILGRPRREKVVGYF